MLQDIRSGVNNLWFRVLIGLLCLSMVILYGFFGSSQLNRDHAAEVNGGSISHRDIAMIMEGQLSMYRNAGLETKDIPKERLFQMQNQILDTLIKQKVLTDQAQKAGLTAAPKEIRESIKSQFTRNGGTFDLRQYRQILERNLGKTPAQFENEEGQRLLAQNFQNAFNQTATLSELDLRKRYETKNRQAKLTYVSIDSNSAKKLLKVSPPKTEELKRYFEENKNRYVVPERRNLELSWISVEPYIKKASESELKKIMQEKFAGSKLSEGTAARYRVKHIMVADQYQADSIIEGLRNGESFSALARSKSSGPQRSNAGDMGYVAQKDFFVPLSFEAIKNLKPGEHTKALKSEYGYHVFQLVNKIDAGPLTTARLKPELEYIYGKRQLSDEKTRLEVIKNAMQAFQNLDADDPSIERLTAQEVKLGDSITGLPDSRDNSVILGRISKLKAEEKSELFQSISGLHVYNAKVTKVLEPYTPDFAGLESRIREELLQKKRQEALNGFANEQTEKLRSGKSNLSSLAKRLGVEKKDTEFFSISSDGNIPGLGSSKDAMKMIANSNSGTVLDPIATGKKIHLTVLSEVKRPDWKAFEEKKDELRGATLNGIQSQRVDAWVDSAEANTHIVRSMRPLY